jgi:hypothetical protein
MAAPTRSRMVSREVRLRFRRVVERALARAVRGEMEHFARLRGARVAAFPARSAANEKLRPGEDV